MISLRSTGKIATGLVLTAVVGAVLFGVLSGRAHRRGAPQPASASIEDAELPPASRTIDAPARGSVQDLVSLSAEGVWTRVDPLTGEPRSKIAWARMDPLEAGLFDIQSPRAWLIEGSRRIEITAQRGRLVWPSRDDEPESGDLEGEVTIRAFDAPSSSADEVETPFVTFRCPRLSFQGALGEVRTSDDAAIEFAGGQGLVRGLMVRFSREKDRPLSALRVDRGGTFRFRPEPDDAGDGGGADAASDPQASRSGPETRYHGVFKGDVRALAGQRELTCGEAEVWVKLFGGRLRPEAIATLDPADSSVESAGASEPGPSASPSDREIELAWSGPFELTPRLDELPELQRDDVRLRAIAAPRSTLTLADHRTGGSIVALSADYGVTSRTIEFSGEGPDGLTFDLPELAKLVSSGTRIDLTAGEGVIPAPGRVELSSNASDSGAAGSSVRPRGAWWRERALFTLDATGGYVGARGPADLRRILLLGGAGLFDGDAGIRGGTVQADFAPGRGEPGGRADLIRLLVDRGARFNDAEGGLILSETVDVRFEPSAGEEPTPRSASAGGGVWASRGGRSVLAADLTAEMARNHTGAIEVTHVHATRGVIATIGSESGATDAEIRVCADDLRAATAMGGMVELVGEPVRLERDSSTDFASIAGRSMRIIGSEESRSLTVFGAGDALFISKAEPSPSVDVPSMRVSSTWTGSLMYSDAAGRAEMEGGVRASMQIGRRERHEARGDSLAVEITPGGPDADSDLAREFVSAMVEGSPDHPAEVEVRRYTDADPDQLESLAFLRGPTIRLDDGGLRLSAPSSGLLLFEDRRVLAEDAGASPVFAAVGRRGTSMFIWEGSMEMDRARGRASFDQNVQLQHRDSRSGETTSMWCQSLVVTLEEPGGPAQPGSVEGLTLRSAEASGAVTAVHRQYQLSCLRMVYDASASTLTAIGDPDTQTRALLYDSQKGDTVSYDRIIVDLASNSYRLEGVGEITTPR